MKTKSSCLLNLQTNILFIIIMIIVLFSNMAIASFSSASTTLRDSIQQNLIYGTTESATLTNNGVEWFKQSIEDITLRTEIQSMDWEQQKPILLYECESLGVPSFAISTLDGTAISTNSIAKNIADTDYYKKALNGITFLTDPFYDPNDRNQMIMICATPIYNKNEEIVGILTATINPQHFFQGVINRRIGITGYGFVINKQGTIIAQPEYEPITLHNNSSPDLKSLIQKMTYGEVGYGSYEDEGIEMFITYAPILKTNWSLAMTVPKNEIFHELEVLKIRFIIITAISIFATILLSLLSYFYTTQHKKIGIIQEDANRKAQLLQESLELDKVKTDFFANISHELRTPINVILGSLQLLKLNINNYQPDQTRIIKHINIMYQNSLRLIRIINNLIDTTKIDAGFFEMNLKNHNIISIVEEITLSVADYTKEKGINLIFDTETEEKITACDTDQIERIMLNLLSNAVKFSHKDGTIYVNIYDRGEHIIISVKDTGIGIPSDKLDLIFQRFRQVDQSLTKKHEGSGIGLSLVKSLVNMHGGNITVSSIFGQGTEFRIQLPIKTELSHESPQSTSCISEQSHYIERINVEFSDIYF